MRHQEKAGKALHRLASLRSGLGKSDFALRMDLGEVVSLSLPPAFFYYRRGCPLEEVMS